jgi:acyl dehydratase
MSELQFKPRGLHFEEFEIGQTLLTASRTVTETDIVNFAGVSGDFNAIHTDAVYAAKEAFGQRVAHGLLVQSIAVGLMVQSGVIEGTTLAFRELTTKFSLPVFIGETIHVQATVSETKAFRRLGGGNVSIKYGVINQDGKTVQRGEWIMLIKSKE